MNNLSAQPARRIDKAEAKEIFDRKARRLLKMGADEFVAKLRNGEFGDHPEETPGVMSLLMILSTVDPAAAARYAKRRA